MPAITGTVLMNMGKQLLKNMTKKAVKGTAKKAVKSVVKKKKVKGKDVAKKMFNEEQKGGALAIRPKADLVASPGGAIKPKETGGDIVKVSGTAARELGLIDFMESLTRVKDSVNGIKSAINDNNKDTVDRIEAQRILNNDLKKKEREKGLEKKDGIGKKLLSPVKDPAEDFLTKMARFAAMTLLGSLIAALMGGARDVILAFRIGIEALKKGLPTLLKGVKALKSGIGKAFKLALRPFKSLGNLVFKGFKALGSKLFGMVKGAIGLAKEAIKNIASAGAKAFPKIANAVNQGRTFAGNVLNRGKDFVKNTARRAAVGAKRFVGRGARKFLKGGGSKILKHGLKRGANRLIIKWFGKGAAKTLMTVGKTLVKGAKAIKIPVIGPLLVAITSMFSGDPIGKTLFKTAGAAIGGGLGLALGPIGMIVGEIAGEFVGDVLAEGFLGGKDGWKNAGKKLKDKFMQILSGGKKVMNWFKNSIGRIKWRKLTFAPWKEKAGILKDAFFPPAEMAESRPNTDAESVSSSASYEDGGEEEPTVVVDSGGESSTPSSASGGSKVISVTASKQTIVNSQYEMVSNAALYKV